MANAEATGSFLWIWDCFYFLLETWKVGEFETEDLPCALLFLFFSASTLRRFHSCAIFEVLCPGLSGRFLVALNEACKLGKAHRRTTGKWTWKARFQIVFTQPHEVFPAKFLRRSSPLHNKRLQSRDTSHAAVLYITLTFLPLLAMIPLLGSSLKWLLLAIVRSSQASSFKPECTIPPPGTTYVSGPNTRGTTSILFNCLSIIFLCTWNIQHLNVPAGRPQPKSAMQGIWWAILDSRIKIKNG